MQDSEILKTFDEQRINFKPYGLTCEHWAPNLMSRPDRHNEIELNYFPKGTITYLLREKRIIVPEKRLAIFWGLVPHQIIDYEGNTPYFVCTIPFSVFLEWNLPISFVDRILKGDVIIEPGNDVSNNDEFLLNSWIKDIDSSDSQEVIYLEMQARVNRLAKSSISQKRKESTGIQSNEGTHVEKIAMYIARNFQKPISVSEIGEEVGLHPDYANSIFKKAFGKTLSEYIIEERISHAQRKLITSDQSISEIAYESGFNSINWFNDTFRRITKATPREFRQKSRGS